MAEFGVLVRQIPWREPEDAFAAFAGDRYVAWLDSAQTQASLGRYSYVAIEPFKVISVADDPFRSIEAELARWRLAPDAAPAPFAGGAVGFFGYGLARALEILPNRHPRQPGLPDMAVGFYDLVLAFDHQTHQAWIFSSGFPELGEGVRRNRATARAEAVWQRLQCAPRRAPGIVHLFWRQELNRIAYENRIRRTLSYIRAGDIFQANFTARFISARPPGLAPSDLHLALRRQSPAPFSAYLGCGDCALVSASPERFIALNANGRIETRPIKGTARRGANPVEDERLARSLQDSVKNRAENLMITDLMRSDIGRAAEIGSVKVDALWQIETYAKLHHLVSIISAQLRPGLTAIDLLRATFPGGSVTGAPKLRAMEIIDELEAAARGAYCGVIAWLGFDGAMDSSIIIRTLTVTPDLVIAQAGGGIVADSDPSEEYEEMLLKLLPLLTCFGEMP